MIDPITAQDFNDRHNKGKKAWALACEEQQKREMEEMEND